MQTLAEVVQYRHAFPVCMITLNILAAMRYGQLGDYWAVGYWLCASGITTCATWGRH